MNLVSVKILFFAKARELSGKKEALTSLETPTKFSFILERLIREYSLHLIRSSLIIAVNETYVDEDDEITLRDGDTIAIIPPISGDLTYENIDTNTITQKVSSPKCGAVSLFVGTTRDNFEDMNVVQLVYEAYNEMALKVMKELCEEVRCKWPDIVNMAIIHRLGEVPVAEASVVIAVASPHRKESLAAVSYAIDRLKATVPIWKKEEYDNGPPCWKENSECKWKNGKH